MKFNDKNIENRILTQVSQLIFEKGVKGWNMDQLSEKAGLAKNTLYRIIGKKEDLIKRVVIDYIRQVQKQLTPILSNKDDYIDSLQRLIRIFPELLDSFYTDHMKTIFLEYPSIELAVLEHKDEITASIIRFIAWGVEQQKLKADLNPEALFELLQAIVMQYSKYGYDKLTIQERLETAFGYIINGIKN